jgi:2-methylcitrate dehydratase PrpD
VVQNQAQYAAHMDVEFEDGTRLHADTDVVLGHADNPMSEADFRGKFEGLVVPVLGAQATGELYALLNDFGREGNLGKIMALVADDARAKA